MLSPAFNTRKDKKLRVCQQVRLVYDDERERERERERDVGKNCRFGSSAGRRLLADTAPLTYPH